MFKTAQIQTCLHCFFLPGLSITFYFRQKNYLIRVQQTVKVAFICHCVRLSLSQKCSWFLLQKWIILERPCMKEISYLAFSGRKILRFLITADVSALAAYVHSHCPESKKGLYTCGV